MIKYGQLTLHILSFIQQEIRMERTNKNIFSLTMILSIAAFYSAMAIFGKFDGNLTEEITGNMLRSVPAGIALLMFFVGWMFVGEDEDRPQRGKRMQILSAGEYLKFLGACFVGAGAIAVLLALDKVYAGYVVWTFTLVFVLEFFALWSYFTHLQGSPREAGIAR